MNMGHTRFTNTVGDLQDCLDHLEDELSPAESKARRRLILTAWDIVQSFLDDEGKLDPAIIKAAVEETKVRFKELEDRMDQMNMALEGVYFRND